MSTLQLWISVPGSGGAQQPIATRPVVVNKDAVTLARELLAMSDEEFRIAFMGSPMKRAKLSGLKRNAEVVLDNVGETRRQG